MAADAIAITGRPRLATVPATAEVIDRFRAALAVRGIVPPESIIADGSIHRCDAAGNNGKGDAAYLLHLEGIPAGGLENWRECAATTSLLADAYPNIYVGDPWSAIVQVRSGEGCPSVSRPSDSLRRLRRAPQWLNRGGRFL